MSLLARLVGGPAEGKLVTVPNAAPLIIRRQRTCSHVTGRVEIDEGRYVPRPVTAIMPAYDTVTFARLFDWDGWRAAA